MDFKNKKLISGFSLTESMITLCLISIFSTLCYTLLINFNDKKIISQLKSEINQINNAALNVATKYESLKLGIFIKYRPGLAACFDGIGENCTCYNQGHCSGEEFPKVLTWNSSTTTTLSPEDKENNKALNSQYTSRLKACSGLNCPIVQSTKLHFECTENICHKAMISVSTEVKSDFIGRDEKKLFSVIPSISNVVTGDRSEITELFKNLTSNCTLALGFNAQLNALDCDTKSFNENRLFASDLGLNVQNNAIGLTLTEDENNNSSSSSSTSSSSSSQSSCPDNTLAVSNNGIISCETPKLDVCSETGFEVAYVNGEPKCLSVCSNNQVRDSNGNCVAKYLNFSKTCGCGFYGSGDPKYLRGQRVNDPNCSSCRQGKPGHPFYFESTIVMSCPSGYAVSSIQNASLGTGEASYAQSLSSTNAQCVGYSTTEQSKFSWVNTSCHLTCVKQ